MSRKGKYIEKNEWISVCLDVCVETELPANEHEGSHWGDGTVPWVGCCESSTAL